jgi:hypothetical protein
MPWWAKTLVGFLKPDLAELHVENRNKSLNFKFIHLLST